MELTLDQSIRQSLTRAFKEGKINEGDILGYLIYFEAIMENEDLVRYSLEKIHENDGTFGDLVNSMKKQEGSKVDLKKIESIKALISYL